VVVAKYWRNGTPVVLTNGTRDAVAYAIAVCGSNVYVSGAEADGQGWVAKIWKNGVATALTDGTQDAAALSVAAIQR